MTNIFVIKSLASADKWSGILYFPTLTLFNSCLILSSSKGKCPLNNAYKIMPQDQISDADPSYGIPYSGKKVSWVYQYILAFVVLH